MLLSNMELIATAPGGVAKLRELILTLAVQGKLVPQDPADEPAGVLLQKIRAEKDRLIAEGKIKRDKPLAEIGEEEKPFELPTQWEWVRLIDLMPEFQNGASSRGDVGGTPITVLRLADIKGKRISLADTRQVPIASADIAKYHLAEGDILITRVNGSADIVGQFNLCDRPVDAIYCDHFIRMRINQRWMEPSFCALLGDSALVRTAIKSLFITTAGQKTVNQGHIGSLQLPLPPLAEQSRIVTRVEALMRLCDALEAKGQLEAAQHAQLVSTLLGTLTASTTPEELAANWLRVAQHFDLLLDRPEAIDALEQTLLQLAVRGLLVPQDPTDEPASALLQKIRAEKDRLIATGQIRRDKPLPPITDEEKPFELPVGWEWVRVGQVASRVQYGVTASADHTQGVPKFVRITDIQNDQVNWDTVPGMQGATQDFSDHFLESGDLLVARTGGTIGKSFLVSSVPVNAVFASYLIRISPTPSTDPSYLKIFASSGHYWQQLYAKSMGTSQPNVNGTALSELTLPLPPLAEQSRIVTRVTALRRLCADLRQRLAEREAVQARLAEALVASVAA